MELQANTILILAPHTDDGELGCGASMARWTSEGKDVHYAAFSLCETSLPAGFPSDTLEKECREATAALGIKPADLSFFHFPVRLFSSHRQDILDELVRLNKQIKPDLVIIPSGNDRHQDHKVIYEEARRAFSHCSMAGYELCWNLDVFRTDLFVTVSAMHVERKIKALVSYRSQSHRDYMQPDLIRSLAKVRGLQAGTAYAEAYEIYNWII